MNKYNFDKIELHLHLDGAFRFSTIWELALRENVKMPKDTLEEYIEYIRYSANCGSVNQYLRMFDAPQLVMQDKENLTRITYELIEDLYHQGLSYAEIRFAPQFHTQKGLSQFDATEAVLEGRKLALGKYPEMRANIIACMMSLGPTSVNEKENYETIEVCKKFRNDGLVGIDLAGAEGIVPLSDFAPFFDKAREYGLNMTCHAGDSQHADTVRDAINFGVSRIGHGHHIYEDENLCKIARDKRITLEICPTSNIQCLTEPSYQKHPAKKLFDLGIPVTINTDNMTLAGTTLEDEYDHCINEMGFTRKDIIETNIYAIEASFADKKTKETIKNNLEKSLKEESQ